MPSPQTKREVVKNPISVAILLIVSLVAFFLVTKIPSNPLIILLIVIFLASFFVFLLKPHLGIYLIILSLIAGQLIRIPIGKGGSSIQITDILVFMTVISWLLNKIFNRGKIRLSFLGPFILIFLSLAVLSLLNGLRFIDSKQALISVFYLIRLILYFLLFFVSMDIFQSRRIQANFVKIMYLAFLLIAALGISQYIFFPDLSEWARTGGWDPHVGRLFSTFLDPNFVGAFLGMGFITTLALLFYVRSLESKVILSAGAVIMLTAVILTYSRSSYLFLFLAFFVFALICSRRLLLLGILVAIVLSLLFPRSIERIQGGFNIDESARLRFQSWERTLTIARDYPVLGVGYNAYRYAQERYSFIQEGEYYHSSSGSDSSALSVLVTTGTVGLLSFLFFIGAAILKSIKTYYRATLPSIKKYMALASGAILVGLIFHSVFVNSLFYPPIMVILLIILGLISTEKQKFAA
jgi:O-antigen ligase